MLQLYRVALSAGKAHRDHKHHHVHKYNHNGAQPSTEPPPTQVRCKQIIVLSDLVLAISKKRDLTFK